MLSSRFLPVLLVLCPLLNTACNASATSDLWPTWGRKLVLHLAASDHHDEKPLLEQLLTRKNLTDEHVSSADFKSRLHAKQAHYQKHPSLKQGILIVAGGRDMFANAAITVLTLRNHLRCQLPVELVHFGPAELPPSELVTLLQSLNSTSSDNSSADAAGHIYITDALQTSSLSAVGLHHKQPKEWKGYYAKAFALAFASRFQQVMLLDADSMPLVDPALLLDMPAFQTHGNVLWPDFWWNAWVNSSIYELAAGMKQPPWDGNDEFRLVDSGQMLIDRLRHADVLEYLWLLNSHHEWVYKHMHGDKDTFLLAFTMAGKLQHFRQVQTYVRDAMTDQKGHQHRFHHLGMVQSIPYKLFAAAVAKAVSGKAGSKAAESAAQRLVNLTDDTGKITIHATSLHDASGRLAAGGFMKSVKLKRELQRHAGLPVVFHRTSFNSKFFPDCLDKKKVASHYCEVQYVSVPLSSHQAGHSLKPHMFAFNEDQVTTSFHKEHCTAFNYTKTPTAARHLQHLRQWQAVARDRTLLAESVTEAGPSTARLQQLIAAIVGLPPEWGCDKLTAGDKEVPIPVMPAQLFQHMLGVLQYSYEAFREVRERLKM